ncbi:helix-turn-helix domain-containing protein [Bacillus sp. 37MA]|uniref:helix-turn-helix domain-containing protein n=1 Tax=Bacillus sp. 37MA TaxID=1132442 RepID=UPI00336C1083
MKNKLKIISLSYNKPLQSNAYLLIKLRYIKDRILNHQDILTILLDNPYKFRIYPNKEKEILIIKTICCSPFMANHFLTKWNNTYKNTSKG